ncbi:hypothetical protein CVU37_10375 [candidate division BRC1 bacterium HGW-BRC1-1]|jgi:type II secretory pathway component GspD/PulD (secretin)|nr:MAG: hypothetical protein CVU37_10375 [candidate division BRC1 bacterium HGW-BRC1-1]
MLKRHIYGLFLAVLVSVLGLPATFVCAQDSPAAPAAEAAAPGSDELITLAFSQTKVEQVVQRLAEKTGKSIVARGKTLGQPVTLILKNQPLEAALDQIANQKPNWLWRKGDSANTFEIWDQESYEAEVLPTRVRQKPFLLREITAEEAYKAIQGVLTPNIGSASFDARSNKVIVTDLPEVLELIQRLIEQIDVKFVTRVFYVAHADVQELVDKLTNLKSPAAPAIDFDVRTHLIIVRDRLEIIRQMELLVETLDVGPELRVYDLNTIGYEGADKTELEEAIQQVLTPDAYYNINTLAGKLLVEDVTEVHEKIEKILEAFDQPQKQVQLQAEIVETRFSNDFEHSIDYTLSGDLFGSVVDGLTGRTDSTTPEGGTATGGSAGNVPIGSGGVTAPDLGFINFRKEFPVVSMGSGGLNAQWLSRHAYITLKSVMSDSRSRILQQPRVLALNQKEVSFAVGQMVPYFSGGSSYNNTTTNNNNYSYGAPQQQRIDVGLTLVIRPVILANGLVQMEVEITNNTANETTQKFDGRDYTAIGTNNQELATTLIIPSGETRVIGGLVSDSRAEKKSGVPGLIKIPILGPALFGSVSKPDTSNYRSNLLIFLTPTIIEEQVKGMRRYKGRMVADESMVEVLEPLENQMPLDAATSVDETLSDTWLEPLPVLTPEPKLSTSMNSKTARAPMLGGVEAKLLAPPTDDTVIREEVMIPVPLGEAPAVVTPVGMMSSPEGLTDLTRMTITDNATTGPVKFRARGPSGAMTGPGAISGASSGSAAAPTVERTTARPRQDAKPDAPKEGNRPDRGQAQAPQGQVSSQPVNPPAPPPSTETRM